MNRRGFFQTLAGAVAAIAVAPKAAQAWHEDFFFEEPFDEDDAYYRELARRRRLRMKRDAKRKSSNRKQAKTASRTAYKGRQVVNYASNERPGTIIIRTRERALYQILPGGRARRYLVAVGREGFAWSGTARIGLKRVNPTWTPPAEMIERVPEYAEWADGMPGGIPENPLGKRALYLYKGSRDTLFRIHGTNSPSSIGTAASSGCIRMLNREVIELYNNTPIGTKVIVS
jgi:lipoprotein-anchoring transpeptidase ErfK/SrfK